ncbi:hypothetical protein GCM10009687_81020 [Asanoa iriomotensis]|uniref:Uncharacterized protein n=1 Tax=Asanoa iriomotensis TaxID=234613 RepID=A0ABQ4CFF1_9ACTN|nr:hypothetical protein Air01nite_75990 [Asanoa iriomotensis]
MKIAKADPVPTAGNLVLPAIDAFDADATSIEGPVPDGDPRQPSHKTGPRRTSRVLCVPPAGYSPQLRTV